MNSIVQERAGGPRGGGLKAKRAKQIRTCRAAGLAWLPGAAKKRGEKGDASRAGAASSRQSGQCTSEGGGSCPSGKSFETGAASTAERLSALTLTTAVRGAALAVLSSAIQRLAALVQISAHAGLLLRVNASACESVGASAANTAISTASRRIQERRNSGNSGFGGIRRWRARSGPGFGPDRKRMQKRKQKRKQGMPGRAPEPYDFSAWKISENIKQISL